MNNRQKLLLNTSIFLLISLMVLLAIWKFSSSEDNHPCAKNRFPGRCYEVERGVCLAQWESAEGECRQSVQALHLPPARLTGPIMDRCLQSKYDRVFHYSRKQNPSCEDEFKQLEAWRKTNPDF